MAGAKAAVTKKRSAKGERLAAVQEAAAAKNAAREAAAKAARLGVGADGGSAKKKAKKNGGGEAGGPATDASLSLSRLRSMVAPTAATTTVSAPSSSASSRVERTKKGKKKKGSAGAAWDEDTPERVPIPFGQAGTDEDDSSDDDEEEEEEEASKKEWYSSAMPPHFLTLPRTTRGEEARTPVVAEKVAVAPGTRAQVKRAGRLADAGPLSLDTVARDLATLLPRYARQPALSNPTRTTALITWAARRGADVLATCRPSSPATAASTILPALATHIWASVGEARALVEANDRRVAATTAAATKAKFAARLAERLRSEGDEAGAAAVETASAAESGPTKVSAVPASVRDGPDTTLLDQGFQRPSVLILVPTRAAAHSAVHALMSVLPDAYGDAVPGLSRFADEYGPTSDGAIAADALAGKPQDYVDFFAGNGDDAFRLGFAVNGGRVKAYTALAESDIIVASPLGLRLLAEQSRIKNKERASAAAAAKRRADERSGRRGVLAAASVTSGATTVSAAPDVADYSTTSAQILSVGDLLSSISLLLVDQAEMLLHAQNAEHAEAVGRMLNRLPRHPGDTDFARVRPYFLDGAAGAHRQTIMLARYPTADLRSFFTRHSRAGAIGGTLDLSILPDNLGVLPLLSRPQDTRHIIRRITVPRGSTSPSDVDDARHAHFVSHLLPALRSGSLPSSIIFVNDTLDATRLTATLAEHSVDAASLSEDVSETAAREALRNFSRGIVGALLLTGRRFFYHRSPPKGTRHVIFYSLPLHAPLFASLASPPPLSPSLTTVSLVSPLDFGPLSRIVGRERARGVLQGDRDIVTF
jgi:U3 small nucleolar RNA-associated protein 25